MLTQLHWISNEQIYGTFHVAIAGSSHIFLFSQAIYQLSIINTLQMYSGTKNHDYLQNKMDRWICSPSVSILLRWCLCLTWKYSLKLANSRLLIWEKLTNSSFTIYPAVTIINNITTEVSFALFPIKKSASIFLDCLTVLLISQILLFTFLLQK